MVTLAVGIVNQRSVVIACVFAAIGVLLLLAGWFGLIGPTNAKPSLEMSDTATELAIQVVSALLAGVIVMVLTGWPVMALFAAAGGWFGLTFKNAKRDRHAAIDRVDAIATWVENLRDNIAGSAGLQQALRMSADHAPEPIRAEVRDLVLRLHHEPVPNALRRFAADVAHPTSDMAVACLILASSRSAGSLASVLARTAQAARDSAAMMRQVDAGRSASQSQAKLVAAVTAVVSLLITVTRPEFVAPYDSKGGQIAIFIICSIFAASAYMLYQGSKPSIPERVFRGVESAPAAAPVVPRGMGVR